jgi:hypothetical protein
VSTCPGCLGAGTTHDGVADAVCYDCDGAGVVAPQCSHGGCREPGRFIENGVPVCRWHKGPDAIERTPRTGYAVDVDRA